LGWVSMSKEEEERWEKKTKAMLKPLEESLGSLSSDLKSVNEKLSRPSPEKGEPDMPIYKCKNGKCSFATDDLDAYLDHMIDHKIHEKPTEEETSSEPRPRRHQTAEEYVNCPECRERFVKAFGEIGYSVTKKEQEPEKKEKPKRKESALP